MAQEVIQRTFSHVLQLFQTRLYSIQPSHPHVCVVAPAARLSPPPGQWLGGGQGAEGAPGCNRLSGDKAHSLQTLLPQPRPAMALPSAKREPWLDRHVFKLQCGKPDGAGAGAGGGKRGLGVRTRPRWRRVQRDTQGGLETHRVLWAVSGGPLRFGGTGGKDWSHSDEIPLVGRTVFVGRSGAGCGVQAVERSQGGSG